VEEARRRLRGNDHRCQGREQAEDLEAKLAVAHATSAALAAGAWHQVGFWRDAVTLSRRALAVTERNWEASSALCGALTADRKLEEAMAACQQALALHPEQPESWNRMGATFGQMGRHLEARRCFEEALRLDHDYGEAWQNLGTTLASLGELERARSCFQEATRLRPEQSGGWAALALACALLGDRAGALGAVLRLERIDPMAAAALRRRFTL
jgi:eukaryotic-like serine/threonine-protein kinase